MKKIITLAIIALALMNPHATAQGSASSLQPNGPIDFLQLPKPPLVSESRHLKLPKPAENQDPEKDGEDLGQVHSNAH